MTNIINGIDVSECEYFEKQHIEDMYESDDCNVCIDNFCALCWKECEKHNGCYFKQLKRLKQQIEAYQLSENEAKEIIAELKYNSKLLRQAHKNEQNKRRKFGEIIDKIEAYCKGQNLKADYTACEVLTIIDEVLNDRD